MSESGKLRLKPVTFRQACEFIDLHHSHHRPPQGHKFSIGVVQDDEELCGVVCVGRPVARNLDDGYTAEVTRCCTDRTKNVASKLYGAAWRAAKAMGYTTLITYTLEEESGRSLVAAGWKQVASSPGGSWSTKSRPRKDKHPTGPKTRWEISVG